MAISKIKAIKSTLRKALDYIMNPEKTENGKLIGSYSCTPETADLEMKITAEKGSGRGDRIAYHLMQSFSPDDDITPEKALELGKEFALKVTGGKYEFVIATHTDGDHIHNHIIFNATSYIDHNKYHYDEKEKYRIRNINDKICRGNNLSVPEKYSRKRGKGKCENEQSRASRFWKEKLNKLRIAIDAAIQQAATFDEFIGLMELEGYKIKHGKHISFQAIGQDGFTRSKTIGEAYTEDAIRKRIENKDYENSYEKDNACEKENSQNVKSVDKEKKVKPKDKSGTKTKQRRINLIVDISKNLKAQQSKGYEQALIKSNINTFAKTMNYLIKHDLKTPEDFKNHFSALNAKYNFAKKNRRKLSMELLDLSEKIKFTQSYKKYKSVYQQSLKATNYQEFYSSHEEEIVQYKSSLIYFEREGINPNILNLSKLFEEYRNIKTEKIRNDAICKELKETIYDLDIIKQNIENSLNIDLTDKEEKTGQSNFSYPKEEAEPQKDDAR